MRHYLLILAMLLCGCSRVGRMPAAPAPAPGILPHVDPTWASGLDALFLYSYAFCIVIIAACVAILVWVPLPSLRKWALMGITFAGCLIGMGITFAIVKPFIPWVILGGVVIGAGIGVWYIVSHFNALRSVIQGNELTPGTQNLVNVCQNLVSKK